MSGSVILVGMPGSGKSTLGVLLAKCLRMQFTDTDLLIQASTGETLQDTLESRGYLELRRIEEEVLLREDFSNRVIATGGSVVYSEAGMQRLRQFGQVVFLDVPLETLMQRVTDYEQRGVARRPGQSFASLFDERRELYLRYSDVTVDCRNLNHEQTLAAVRSQLRN